VIIYIRFGNAALFDYLIHTRAGTPLHEKEVASYFGDVIAVGYASHN